MIFFARFIFLILFPLSALAATNVVNVYGWSGEIPDTIVQQFEKETGIKVNFSTYENNEVMYAKLRTTKNAGYDVIIPYSSFLERMGKQDMLAPLDKSKLSNWKNIDTHFLNSPVDPESKYGVPFLWGITGIFVNTHYHDASKIKKFADLWDKQFVNQLLMLDDVRDMFSMALLTLGYSIKDHDPNHIEAAYLKLKDLLPNVKVFATDMVVSIIIDEDATLGMAWSGDAFKAWQENPAIAFVYPEEGFVISVDSLAIPKNAPHLDNAHAFINYMLRPDVAKEIALYSGYPITNTAGRELLPKSIRDNPIMYPSKAILRRGHFITDAGEATLGLYEKYWEQLKMSS